MEDPTVLELHVVERRNHHRVGVLQQEVAGHQRPEDVMVEKRNHQQEDVLQQGMMCHQILEHAEALGCNCCWPLPLAVEALMALRAVERKIHRQVGVVT
jgi:hypothetical protein